MEIANNHLINKSLRSSRIFGDLGDALLSNIAFLVSLSIVKSGDFVFQQAAVDSMFVLVSGRLGARYMDDGKIEQIFQHLYHSICTGSKVKLIGPAEGNKRMRDNSDADQISIMMNKLEPNYDTVYQYAVNQIQSWTYIEDLKDNPQ